MGCRRTRGSGGANDTPIVTLEPPCAANPLKGLGGLAERTAAELAYLDVAIHNKFAVFSKSKRIRCVVRNISW